MSAYKKRKLIAFAKHVGMEQRDPEEIIHAIAPVVICEGIDFDCPIKAWCHNSTQTYGVNGKISIDIVNAFCRSQLLKWWKQ